MIQKSLWQAGRFGGKIGVQSKLQTVRHVL